jgi:hypothetical protein
MPPCGHCKLLNNSCDVNTQSRRCRSCIRRELECDLILTQGEWSRLKREKADLEQALNRNEVKKQSAVVEILRLRKKLEKSTAQNAAILEQNLAAATETRDTLEEIPVLGRTFSPSPTVPHEEKMRPREWALLEHLPIHFWAPPCVSLDFEDETLFGEFDGA